MAEWFVGPIMEKLINTCFEYLQDQLNSKENLERLRQNHPKIQAVVSAASQAQIIDQNPALNKWIWQLRDAIDEADDLFDEFEYMRHQDRVVKNKEETNKRSSGSFLLETAHKIFRGGEGALKIGTKLKRAEEVMRKLDGVSAEVSTFLHLLESVKQDQREQQLELHKIRETGSLPKDDLIGRGKEKESVMQWLRKPSNEEHHQTLVKSKSLYRNISFLSIVGHGGIGKTTLLQHIYEDEMTKEFDLKMWVCVSHNFDIKKVIADMLESLTLNRSHLQSLDALQSTLKSEVMSKKFLLVLDDIWEEEEERDKSKWENVLAPLSYGGFGSKILITTRMDSVALMIAKIIKKKKETVRLQGLEEGECLQLLNTHAFADVENSDDLKKLRSIAGLMSKKLFGSPLAAKVMGGVLNSSLDEMHWTKVLNTDLGHNDIFPILKLSFIFLPKYLQSCFTFCCIFKQDHIFDKDDLVRMWIAVGFIQPSCIQGETIEDIGGRYFDVLVKKSFFDKDSAKGYKMHDLIHELARSVSTQECFRDMGDKQLLLRIPETIRHLSIQNSNLEVLRMMGKFKNLRTLYIIHPQEHFDIVDVLTENIEVYRSIRLLFIDSFLSFVEPERIGYLMHLRYLKFEHYYASLLPRSLSNLYHLQFLIINRVYDQPDDDFFPKDLNNLSNLCHLRFPSFKFPGIGKLKFLQKLNEFNVEKETGYSIVELVHMNDLRLLGIKRLENVRDAEEACNAKLCDKRKLTKLSLEWSKTVTRQNIADPEDEMVLDNLQPHNILKKLTMKGYMGVRPAIWMNKAHLINNLEFIKLDGCLKWHNLPPFGQLPFLKFLSLRHMPKAKWFDHKFPGNDMCCVFPSLEQLHIIGLEALEDWFDTQVEGLFPCLTELKLYDCPNLQELPYLPPKLETLEIHSIGWKTLNCCGISGTLALRNIKIVNCPNLISFGRNQKVETTDNFQLILDDLTISDSSMLQMEPLRSVTSIQNLSIINNYELVSFPYETEKWFQQVSSSLRVLEFRNLQSLQSLPSSLSSISSLNNLYMEMLPQLQLLPNIPAYVEHLSLNHLEELRCLSSSLSTISSLKHLYLNRILLLKSLSDLPPSLCTLSLYDLDILERLPSCLSSISSLTRLYICRVPQLRELPDLPPSLCKLSLRYLDCLECLPSSLPNLCSLTYFFICRVPRLRELPDLPPCLKYLDIIECDPELTKRYENFRLSFD